MNLSESIHSYIKNKRARYINVSKKEQFYFVSTPKALPYTGDCTFLIAHSCNIKILVKQGAFWCRRVGLPTREVLLSTGIRTRDVILKVECVALFAVSPLEARGGVQRLSPCCLCKSFARCRFGADRENSANDAQRGSK